jgi:nucleotide-binding universal stress UspA family protein
VCVCVCSVAARDQLLIVHHEPNSTKRGEAFGLLNAFAAMAHKAGMMHTRTKLLSGRTSVVKAVKKCIQEEEPSLVVVASRGLGAIKRTFLGSVSDHTVHHSRCPVLVIHRDKQNTTNVVKSLHNPPHMVIAIDRTAESRRAFEWLVENALPSNVALTLLHVQRMQPYERHFQSDHDDANRFLDELIQSCRPKTQRQVCMCMCICMCMYVPPP